MPILRYAYIRWWDLALEVVVVYRAIHSEIILSLHKVLFFNICLFFRHLNLVKN